MTLFYDNSQEELTTLGKFMTFITAILIIIFTIRIIGTSLQNNEAYLRYLWIDNLQNEHNQVIYVPTETNLPILEASRLNKH
ncbi:MAG: hypothetical protein PVJ67_03935 [Candidatus Pacearchaeota archaeon]|jgi:hypothetical protein